jgi:uncharacterized OsmC-like protein
MSNVIVLNGKTKYFVPDNEIEDIVKKLEEVCPVVEELDEEIEIDVEPTDGIHTETGEEEETFI